MPDRSFLTWPFFEPHHRDFYDRVFTWSHGEARHGEACHGEARHGEARHGEAGHGEARHGEACHGEACHGEARHGEARHGEARHGEACHGEACHGEACHGEARHGEACHGEACHGEARHGEACHGEVSNHGRGIEATPPQAVKTYLKTLAGDNLLQPVLDLEVRTLCLAREALAYHDALADFAFAMQGLGSAPISLFGTSQQREQFLPAVASGSQIMAFALSEREAGSDVAATATAAKREAGDYIIDGEKTWISNAGIAGVYIVFARTSANGAKGLTAFIVPAGTPGLDVVQQIETISPHPLGTLRFERVRVPAEYRIGEEGQGFKIAMATLDIFRATVGAAALGLARRALDETIAHVRSRRIFGAPLADQQLTQAALAGMATKIDASALLVYRAAFAKDSGAQRVTREAAMAKWFATESAGEVADRAVQLFGGRGVTRGEIVERIYRDLRALRIYEGASEIQQIVIARSILSENTAPVS